MDAETEYTVYVRNVSGIRTLTDGSQAAKSVAGSVKTFMTLKPQVKYLSLDVKSYDKETSKWKNVTAGKMGESLQLFPEG